MVVSLAALAVALGGTAYANGLIGPSQIDSEAVHAKHVKAGAIDSDAIRNLGIQAIDLGRASVNSSKIRNGSVRAEDLASDAVTAAAISPASITAESVANGTLTAAKFMPNEQPPRAFMSRVMSPGDPASTVGTWNGFRVRAECRPGGGRTTAVLIDRGGDQNWGTVGSRMWDPTPGDPAGVVPEVPMSGGVATFELTSSLSDTAAETATLYNGTVDGSAGVMLHFVISNAAGVGQTGCLVAGYAVSLVPQ
jgi:hypothetical protein